MLPLAVLLSVVAPADYAKDIRPLVRERCTACHGALQQKAKLRLDTVAGMLARGVVVPGKPAESPLLDRVKSADPDARMPPDGHPLTADQVAAISRWIEQGAKAPADDTPEADPRDHWAFRPVKRPPVPAAGHPIDAFVTAAWQKAGVTPVGPADKRLLLRRVTIDLTGLPPTAAEYAAFAADASPDAYEKVVDRLLASPQYGERWARHFLDIWRYADWWGINDELRNSHKHLWHWREWAVEGFNADLGYDEMVRQMLAADELYPTDQAKLRATGYLARPYFLHNRSTWLEDLVEHTGKGFLGLTANCAKCHDHKYDPITQANYYQLRAIFEPYQLRTDLVPHDLDPERAGIPRAFDCDLDRPTRLFVRGDERTPDPDRVIEPGLPRFLLPNGLKVEPVNLPVLAYRPGRRPEIVAAYRKQAEARLTAAQARAKALEVAFAGRSAWLRTAAWQAGRRAVGAAEVELERVWRAEANPADRSADLPGAAKTRESNAEPDESYRRPFPATSTGRRAAFARWVADPANPLTARVAVNHVWLRHFGTPLVPTVFDFGVKGKPPTHPELLDWLASEFVSPQTPPPGPLPAAERGDRTSRPSFPPSPRRGGGRGVGSSPQPWSFKHLHRLIVTSNVYRLSSSAKGAEAAMKADPENRLLWRMNPQRVQAEVVRDGLLHLAGDLDLTAGGPAVPPPEQAASRRRSLYFFRSKNDTDKLVDTFDGPSALECYRRAESVVPQQALALWNGKLALTAADRIAGRITAADDDAFVTAAFGLVLGAEPSAAERAACLDALAELRAALAGLPAADRERRARARLVQALVNHNDFVTVR